jgi:hypothetical protein
VSPYYTPKTSHFAGTVYEDLCVFCSYQNLAFHAFAIRIVTYKVTYFENNECRGYNGLGVWLGWILRNKELCNLYMSLAVRAVRYRRLLCTLCTSVDVQDVSARAINAWGGL